jgi:predicted secreted protein
MTYFSAFVLYAILWFLTLFVVLPLRLVTQGEAGQIVPGTPESAPQDAQMRKRLTITTLVSALIWAVVIAVILSGVIGLDDIDLLYRATR